MQCLYCNQEALFGKACCQNCFDKAAQESAQKKERAVNEGFESAVVRRKKGKYLLGGAIVALVLLSFFRPRFFNEVALVSPYGVSDPCVGKKSCLIMYAAPWCPSCHAAKDFMVESCQIINRGFHGGCKVVIGWGSKEENREMASEIGAAAFLDDEGKLGRELGVRSVPTWVLASPTHEILKKGSGLPAESDEEIVKLFFKQELGDAFTKLFR